MKNKLSCLLLLCLFVKGISAQVITGGYGAEAGMLAGNSVTLTNIFSVFNNPASMSGFRAAQSGVFSERRFNQQEMSLSAVAGAMPLGGVTCGLGLAYYGFTQYNVQRYLLGVSIRLMEKLFLGVQTNYLLTNVLHYGATGRLFFGGGVLFQPVAALRIGFMLLNPHQGSGSEKMQVPSIARLGGRYQYGALAFLGEVQLETSQSVIIRGGVSYRVAPAFALAGGVASGLSLFAFGTMFTYGKLRFEASGILHQYLGVYPQISLVFPNQSDQ